MTQQTEERAVMKWEESGIALETVGMARAMVTSGYFKNVTSVAQAIVKIEMGKSLGVTPVEAMQYLHIFESGGRTSIQLGYVLVGSLIQRSGKYRFEVKTRTDELCEIDFYQVKPDGSERLLGTSKFTIAKAKAAGLAAKDVWKAYPDVLLYARALTHGARAFCPEVLGGAGVNAEEPYIEGRARVVVSEDSGPVTIDEPPEGYPNPWAKFWAQVKDIGYDKPGVHDYVGVGPEDGALKEAVERKAKNEGKPIAQVLAELTELLRDAKENPPNAADEGDWENLAETAAQGALIE
jgi:hypothetical protein